MTAPTDFAEPIHTWFGLSYSSHLVFDEVVTGHLNNGWHLKMAAMLDQLNRAFPDVNRRGDVSLAILAEEYECGDLTAEQMAQIGMTTSDGLDDHSECDHEDDEDENWGCERDRMCWYDWRGDEHQRDERVMVPTESEEQARWWNRIVVSRTLLQSMPSGWQAEFIALADQATFGEIDRSYELRFYTTAGDRTTDPVPHYQRGRTYIEPRLEALA